MKKIICVTVFIFAFVIIFAQQGWRTYDYNLDRSGFYPYSSISNDLSNYGLKWTRPGKWPLSGHLIGGTSQFQIACLSSDSLIIYNGAGNKVGGFLLPASDLTFNYLNDINDDGLDEVFLTSPDNSSPFYLWILTPNGNVLRNYSRTGGNIMNYDNNEITWAGNGYDSGWSVLGVIAPIPSSTKKIVMVLRSGYSSEPRGIEVLDYNTSSTSWYFDKGTNGSEINPVSDIFNDGRYEILPQSNTSHNGAWGRGYLGNAPLMTDGDNWSVMIRDDGVPLFTVNHFVDGGYYHRVSDMDNTGYKEIIGFEEHDPTYYTGYAKAYKINPISGSYDHSVTLGYNRNLWGGYFGDVNNDGIQELAVSDLMGSSSTLYILDQNLNIIRSHADYGFPCSMNDINGDNKSEILTYQPVDTRQSLYIYNGNLQALWHYTFSVETTTDMYDARITDLDQDGYNEIFLSRSDNLVYVLGHPTVVSNNDQIGIDTQTVHVENYPNPFSTSTTIKFDLNQTSVLEANIYNVRGQRVRQLVCENLSKGTHEFSWTGKDQKGNHLYNGIYFIKASVNGHSTTRKILLLR